MIKKSFLRSPKALVNLSIAIMAFHSMPIPYAHAGIKDTISRWENPFNNKHNNDYFPYLENSRHLQIPQWAEKNWYVEDWTSHTKGLELISKFYQADIIRDQKINKASLPTLVVGPNFYHLSGLDKRRVVTTIDNVYGVTTQKEDAAFLLTDWHTKKTIGTFDKHGLRLH